MQSGTSPIGQNPVDSILADSLHGSCRWSSEASNSLRKSLDSLKSPSMPSSLVVNWKPHSFLRREIINLSWSSELILLYILLRNKHFLWWYSKISLSTNFHILLWFLQSLWPNCNGESLYSFFTAVCGKGGVKEVKQVGFFNEFLLKKKEDLRKKIEKNFPLQFWLSDCTYTGRPVVRIVPWICKVVVRSCIRKSTKKLFLTQISATNLHLPVHFWIWYQLISADMIYWIY